MKIRNDQRFIDQFLTHHRNTAVAAIEALEIDEIALLLENVAPDKIMIILSGMAPYRVVKVLEKMPVTQAVGIIGVLPIEISKSILRAVNSSLRKKILVELPPDVRKPLKRSLTFNRTQVGAHLKPSFFTLSESSSVETALSEIKATQVTVQSQMFVIDKKKVLVGYLEATDLLSNSSETTIRSIMKPAPSTVVATMLVKDVLEHWDDSMVYLPVVNADNQVIGIVSRGTLSNLVLTSVSTDRLEVKAGSALGDLYLVGLTGLLGGTDHQTNP